MGLILKPDAEAKGSPPAEHMALEEFERVIMALEGLARARGEIGRASSQASFSKLYLWLIPLWTAFVLACVVAEAIVRFCYERNLFSDGSLKWLVAPVTVGLFSGAALRHLSHRGDGGKA